MSLRNGIQLNLSVWQEGKMFVSYIPQLDISSCGHTIDEARQNIREALKLFFEEIKRMGTWRQVLEEAGFNLREKEWIAPEEVPVFVIKNLLRTAGINRERYLKLLSDK